VDKRGRYDFGSVAARAAARGAGLAAATATSSATVAGIAANGDAKAIRIKVECTF